MTTEKEKFKTVGADVFDQAMKNYEQAFRAGIKMQEEVAKWCTGFLTKAPAADVWQKRAQAAAEEVVPNIQKLVEDSLKVVEQSSRASLDLFKKGMDATRSTSIPEGQARLQQLWETSLQTLQANVQAVAHINSRVMESWTEFARKGAEYAEPGVK